MASQPLLSPTSLGISYSNTLPSNDLHLQQTPTHVSSLLKLKSQSHDFKPSKKNETSLPVQSGNEALRSSNFVERREYLLRSLNSLRTMSRVFHFLRDTGIMGSLVHTSSLLFGPISLAGQGIKGLKAIRNAGSVTFDKRFDQNIFNIKYESKPRGFKAVSSVKTVEFYPCDLPSEQSRPLFYFVHGGAWFSGSPFVYRPIVNAFHNKGIDVALLEYTLFPGGDAFDMAVDIEEGLRALYKFGEAQGSRNEYFNSHSTPFDTHPSDIGEKHPKIFKSNYWSSITQSGHSSGSHVTFLALINRIVGHPTSPISTNSKSEDEISYSPYSPGYYVRVDGYCGLSGPYNVHQHFDFETRRGVADASPLSPACGVTSSNLRLSSGGLRLEDYIGSPDYIGDAGFNEEARRILPSNIMLLNGVEDDCVPFTNTFSTAATLRRCGIGGVEECYLGGKKGGHVDIIMGMMFDDAFVMDEIGGFIDRVDSNVWEGKRGGSEEAREERRFVNESKL